MTDEAKADDSAVVDEWMQARAKIDACDERIDSIRKQGLTFVTGLLTAQSLLGIELVKADGTRATIGYVVFVFSLAVVVTIRFIEKQQQMLQSAAAARCLVLESARPTELTGTISDRSAREHWPLFTLAIYFSFGVLAYALYLGTHGAPANEAALLTKLLPVTQLVSAKAVLALFVGTLLWLTWLDLRPTDMPGLDWSVNTTRLRCGDLLEVRVVNLCHDARPLLDPPILLPLQTLRLRTGLARADRRAGARWPSGFDADWVPWVLFGWVAAWCAIWLIALPKATDPAFERALGWRVALAIADIAAFATLAVRKSSSLPARMIRERMRDLAGKLRRPLEEWRSFLGLCALAALLLVAYDQRAIVEKARRDLSYPIPVARGHWFWAIGGLGATALLALGYACGGRPIRDRIELPGWPEGDNWRCREGLIPLLPGGRSLVWQLGSVEEGVHAVMVIDPNSGKRLLLDKKPIFERAQHAEAAAPHQSGIELLLDIAQTDRA